MPQVGFHHRRVARHLRRRALGDEPALRQHPDLRGQAHDRAHHVLDHQHGHAIRRQLAHHGNHLVDLGRVQPRQHLVQQQQPGPGGQRARQLQALAPAHGQVGGGLVQLRAQVDAARDGLGGRQRVGPPRQAQVRADGDVLAHGLRAEGLHDLEGARHAQARGALRRHAGDVPAVEQHLALVRAQKTRQQSEQRGLARAVGTDQRADAAGWHRQADVLHGLQAAEADG